MERSWYQQDWAIIALLVFFFPVGLYLMWRHASWQQIVKWAVSGAFAILVVIAVVSSALSGGSDDADSESVVGDEPTAEASPTQAPESTVDDGDDSAPINTAAATEPPEPTRTPAPTQTEAAPPPLVFQPASDFPAGSAEQTLANWVAAWRDQDWQRMANLSQLTWVDGEADPAGSLAAAYDFKDLMGFEVTGVSRVSEVTADVTFVVAYEAFTDEVERYEITARVIREDGPLSPSPQGQWGVNPTSALRETDMN